MSSTPRITPAVMIGGVGTRLWPLSRADRPKQFHRLGGEATLVQDTLLRFGGPLYDRPWLLASRSGADAGEAHAAAVGVEIGGAVIEPAVRSTAPALAAAALAIGAGDPDRLILAAPADHVMAAPDDFHRAVAAAAPAAARGAIVCFGIRPTHAETGFGYVEVGEEDAEGTGVHRVASFREKPSRDVAEAFLAGGRHLWNAGIFLFSARTLAEEVERHAPDVAAAVARAVALGRRAGGRLDLDPVAYAGAPDVPVDTAVMEKSGRVAVAPCDPGWSDVGSWAAVHAASARDGDGNAFAGDVVATATRDCLVHAVGGRLVAVAGLSGVAVVDTGDATLVTALDSTQRVKDLVAKVLAGGRTEASVSPLVEHAWGAVRRIGADAAFAARHLAVHAGETVPDARSGPGGTTVTVAGGILDLEYREVRRRLRPGRSCEVPPNVAFGLVNVGGTPAEAVVVDVRLAAADAAGAPAETTAADTAAGAGR